MTMCTQSYHIYLNLKRFHTYICVCRWSFHNLILLWLISPNTILNNLMLLPFWYHFSYHRYLSDKILNIDYCQITISNTLLLREECFKLSLSLLVRVFSFPHSSFLISLKKGNIFITISIFMAHHECGT